MECFGITLRTALAVALAVVAAVLLVVLGTVVWQAFEGGLISQHTRNIRHEIGYVDAQNAHCQQDISDYSSAKASYARDAGDPQAQAGDQGHMLSLVVDCRATVGQLSSDEVSAPVAQFLAAHREDQP